jgi:hypothetical protein
VIDLQTLGGLCLLLSALAWLYYDHEQLKRDRKRIIAERIASLPSCCQPCREAFDPDAPALRFLNFERGPDEDEGEPTERAL